MNIQVDGLYFGVNFSFRFSFLKGKYLGCLFEYLHMTLISFARRFYWLSVVQ